MKIAIQLTNKCSKKCPWCYAQSSPEGNWELDYKELVKFISELSELPQPPLLCLGGGEPFEYSHIIPLIKSLEDLRYPYSLTSNLLRAIPGDCKINHGWLWGSIHHPAETKQVVSKLKALGVPNIGVNLLVMRSYLSDLLEITDYLESEHVPFILTFYKTFGRGAHFPQEKLTPAEKKEIIKKICIRYGHGVYTDACQGLTGKTNCGCGVTWFTITENKELRPNSFYPTGIKLAELSLGCFNMTKKIIPQRVHTSKQNIYNAPQEDNLSITQFPKGDGLVL